MTRTAPWLALALTSLASAGELGTADDDLISALELPEHTPEAIINGEAIGKDVFPETGGLIISGIAETPFGTQEMRQFACSSTLIAPDVVLLAAHCVDPAVISQGGTIDDLEFRWSRKADLSKPASPFDDYPDDAIKAIEAAHPPEWNIANMQNFSLDGPKYDIALLFLEEAVTTPYAILPTLEEAEAIVPGASVEIVGWGMQEPIGIMDGFTPPDAGTFAEKFWGISELGEVGDYEFQVGNSADDTRKCRGDSGGPTFLPVDADTVEAYRLVGVTSRSADFTLCETEGGFDTRVDAYLGWIEEEMSARCADGTRVWCDETGIPAASPAVEDEKKGGCSHLPGGAGGLAILLAGVGLTRRRT